MNTISCRKQEKGKVSDFIQHRYANRVAVNNGEGNVMYVEREPVEPSRAEDFSITANALYGRSGVASYRVNTDVVDLPNKLNKLNENE